MSLCVCVCTCMYACVLMEIKPPKVTMLSTKFIDQENSRIRQKKPPFECW